MNFKTNIKNNNKTKKNKIVYRKKKRYFTKKKGGASSNPNINESNKVSNENKESNETNSNAIDEIKKQVQEEKNLHLGDNNILAKTGDLAQGVAVNAVDKVGDFLGVDLDDPNFAEKNKEQLKHISENAAEIGNVVVESVEPFTKPLIDKSLKASGKILSDVGETGVKVLLNTAEEIPGAGIIIGSLRSLGSIGDAVVSSVNAGSEVISSSADTINASVKNFDRLIKEKEEIANRTKASINEFTGGFKSRKKYIGKKNQNRKTKRRLRK